MFTERGRGGDQGRMQTSWRILGFGASLAVAAACGGDGGGEPRESADTTASTTSTTAGEAAPRAVFTFDYLEGGSQVVRVFAGPGESAADREATGTFLDGQQADIDCVEFGGRPVPHDPEVGERDPDPDSPDSTIWVRLNVPGDVEMWAADTYGDPSAPYPALPEC